MSIVFALLSAGIGLAMLFAGYRLARIIIPIWGFVAGLSLGGGIIADMNSTPFLGTVIGITIGLILGAVFALLAYLYYSLAVVVLIGGLGYWAGSNFMVFLGLEPGFISAMSGLVLGVLLGVVALQVNAPKYVLIVVTSIAGALATIGGILLLFGQIPLEAYNFAVVHAAISYSWLWTLVMAALAIIGVVAQSVLTSAYEFEDWSFGGREHMPPTTHAPGMR